MGRIVTDIEFRFPADVAGELINQKLAAILNVSASLLPIDDLHERIDRCRRAGSMLLTISEDPDDPGWALITWARARLCVVDRTLLDDATPIEALWEAGPPAWLPEVPDDPSGLM